MTLWYYCSQKVVYQVEANLSFDLGQPWSDKKISGIHGTQATKHATQGRRHQKSKTGVSVAPQKGLMSSKNF